MDLKDQLRNLFPDHVPETKDGSDSEKKTEYWMQSEPILCKYEKRNGKPVTVLEGYTGADKDFNLLTRELKKSLNVGGSFKNEKIIIQGNFRDLIMDFLKEKGFKVKRVGG
jgi:translation initiation factor 1